MIDFYAYLLSGSDICKAYIIELTVWIPAWEAMSGGIRCLRLYEVSEIPCKSMAVFWHFFYCPGKGIPDNKKYFVGYHTLYGMEPKWSHSFFV